MKVDRDKQAVVVDEFYEDITIEDLKDEVAEHQPRYIIYTYKMIHDDQRVSYPMCFIFYTPRDSQVIKKFTEYAMIREIKKINEEISKNLIALGFL